MMHAKGIFSSSLASSESDSSSGFVEEALRFADAMVVDVGFLDFVTDSHSLSSCQPCL